MDLLHAKSCTFFCLYHKCNSSLPSFGHVPSSSFQSSHIKSIILIKPDTACIYQILVPYSQIPHKDRRQPFHILWLHIKRKNTAPSTFQQYQRTNSQPQTTNAHYTVTYSTSIKLIPSFQQLYFKQHLVLTLQRYL